MPERLDAKPTSFPRAPTSFPRTRALQRTERPPRTSKNPVIPAHAGASADGTSTQNQQSTPTPSPSRSVRGRTHFSLPFQGEIQKGSAGDARIPRHLSPLPQKRTRVRRNRGRREPTNQTTKNLSNAPFVGRKGRERSERGMPGAARGTPAESPHSIQQSRPVAETVASWRQSGVSQRSQFSGIMKKPLPRQTPERVPCFRDPHLGNPAKPR